MPAGSDAEVILRDVPIVKDSALDTAPSGFKTVTFAVPTEAIRLAGAEAVNCAPLTYVVDSAVPFH